MKFAASTALVASALAFGVVSYAAPATACDPPQTQAAIVTPGNGDTLIRQADLFVLGHGVAPTNGGGAELTKAPNQPIELEPELYERPGDFNWALVYRPTDMLEDGQYDFVVPYVSDGQSELVSFQVADGSPADLREPRIPRWKTATFRPAAEDQCSGAFTSLTQVTFGGPSGGTMPLWYEVELASYDGEDSTHRAVVPGSVDGDRELVQREIRADFDVECLYVTPVSPYGERGEPFESCEPEGCDGFAPEEADSDSLWEDLDECDQTPPQESEQEGGSSADESGCGVVDAGASPVLPAAVALLLLVGWRVRRHRLAAKQPAG